MTDQTPLTSVLRAAARNSDKLLTAALAPLELTGPRLELLAVYAEHPGITNADAAAVCDLSPQSAHMVTVTLADKGWIAIDAPADRRRQPVHVTDAGLEALDAAWDASRPLEKRLATLLGAAGIRRLRSTADVLSAQVNGPQDAAAEEEDPRFAQVGNTAAGLHYRALMWADAHKTDTIPRSVVNRWSSPQAQVAQRLVTAGLWKPDGNEAYKIR